MTGKLLGGCTAAFLLAAGCRMFPASGQPELVVEELTRYGDRFDESGDWRIMAARYNYSVNLPEIEYSATSLLPKTSFHLREEYSKLIFRKKPEKEQ